MPRRFLSVCLAQDVSTVSEQRSPVAVHDCLEGGGRPLPGELGQPLVALGAKDRGPRQSRRGSQDGIQVWLPSVVVASTVMRVAIQSVLGA